MIRHRPIQLRAHGFTLMELLLAVAVFAIVLAAINSVFFSALRLRNKTQESLERSLPLQQAVAILKRDLAGLMWPGGALGGQLQTAAISTDSTAEATGQRVTPDLYTNTGLIDTITPFSEVQRVAYFLAIPPDRNAPGKDLMRTVTRNLLVTNSTDQPDPQFIMGGIDSMALTYFDGTNWATAWDSTTTSNLPSAIRVQIAVAREAGVRTTEPPVEFIVPVYAKGRTNSTSNTGGGGS